jgi:FixJ family two-component response regulator
MPAELRNLQQPDGVEPAPAEVVCVVDDDSSVRKSIGNLLKADGLNVRAFGEPALFLEYLAANPVPVVVLDVWMDRMTGMELLAHLCARSPDTRAIFITGHEDPAAQATVTAAGAFAFLIKTFDGEDLLAEVRRALNLWSGKGTNSRRESQIRPAERRSSEF